jgi:hypothetical protein
VFTFINDSRISHIDQMIEFNCSKTYSLNVPSTLGEGWEGGINTIPLI